MITVRKNEDRGAFHFDWLSTQHTFSFGDYFDAHHMNFRALRVINEDIIEPGQGFPLHRHHDMEIITYILEGELEHRDSLGNRETIRTGEFQRMTAGTGIRHSEYNASSKTRVHLLQIWILPETKDLEPGYEQKSFPKNLETENLRLVASSQAEKNSLKIHQDAKLYVGNLSKKDVPIIFPISDERHAWVQMVRGNLLLNGENLHAGDGAAILMETQLKLECKASCEFLLFDLS